MFDDKRRYKNCIFCNVPLTKGTNGNASREHIFGKAVAKLHPTKVHWRTATIPGLEGTEPFYPIKKGGSPLLNITSKGVCQNCNSNKLEAFQNNALPFLEVAINGGKLDVSRSNPIDILLYFQRLAMIVDIETSNYQLDGTRSDILKYANKFGPTRAYDPLIDQKERTNILNGVPSKEINVFLGKHKGRIGKLIPCNLVPQIDPFNHQLAGKKFIFAIGELVVILRICGVNIFSAHKLIMLNANQHKHLSWPPHEQFTYDDFLGNYTQDRNTRWLRKLLGNRHYRRMAEKNILKKGDWDLPPPPPSFQ